MKLLFAALLALPAIACAHPGHDHSASTSLLLHAIWVLPAVITVAVMVVMNKDNDDIQKNDKD